MQIKRDVDPVLGLERMRHYVRWRVQQWVLAGDNRQPRAGRGAAADLVRLSGVSAGSISQIVRHKLLPDTASCGVIARALGLDLHALIELAMGCRAIDHNVATALRTPSRRGRPLER